MADKLSWTHICACGRTTVCRALRMIATGISFQSRKIIRRCAAEKLLRDSTVTGKECHCTTFLLLGKVFRLHLSANEVACRLPTAKFSNIPNHTRTLKSPRRRNNKMFPSSEIGSFVAELMRDNFCFKKFVGHSFYRKACWLG